MFNRFECKDAKIDVDYLIKHDNDKSDKDLDVKGNKEQGIDPDDNLNGLPSPLPSKTNPL